MAMPLNEIGPSPPGPRPVRELEKGQEDTSRRDETGAVGTQACMHVWYVHVLRRPSYVSPPGPEAAAGHRLTELAFGLLPQPIRHASRPLEAGRLGFLSCIMYARAAKVGRFSRVGSPPTPSSYGSTYTLDVMSVSALAATEHGPGW